MTENTECTWPDCPWCVAIDALAEDDNDTIPPEWQAWHDGTGRCPYCVNMTDDEWRDLCDCFMVMDVRDD